MAEGLRKRYGATEALAGFDVEVAEGTVCGLLGPNGAGKTTAVRILATLLRADGGTARVAGYDVRTDAAAVRHRIGLLGQQASLDEVLSGRENLLMWARLYHLDRRTARRRADELLEQFGLTDAAGKQVKHYSGGMRRRLDLAASFTLAPRVLFLDEPTTGLDPKNRNEVWAAVRSLVADGTTVILTTQYLDEADQLADQVVVMDAGRAVADGTPRELKARLGGEQLDVVVRSAAELAGVASALGTVTGGEPRTDVERRLVSVPAPRGVATLTDAVRALDASGVEPEDIGLRKPTLDEVFLRLTGHAADASPGGDRRSTSLRGKRSGESSGSGDGSGREAEEVPA
jgi:ABC-2 type transport system ATP-binding protein